MNKAEWLKEKLAYSPDDLIQICENDTIGSWSDDRTPIVRPSSAAMADYLRKYQLLADMHKLDVGDKVFHIVNGKIVSGRVSSIIVDKRGTTYWYSRDTYAGDWKFGDASIGATVFLTEEAANNALNMQGEDEVNKDAMIAECVYRFMNKNDVSSAEDVYQDERVSDACGDFVAELVGIVLK